MKLLEEYWNLVGVRNRNYSNQLIYKQEKLLSDTYPTVFKVKSSVKYIPLVEAMKIRSNSGGTTSNTSAFIGTLAKKYPELNKYHILSVIQASLYKLLVKDCRDRAFTKEDLPFILSDFMNVLTGVNNTISIQTPSQSSRRTKTILFENFIKGWDGANGYVSSKYMIGKMVNNYPIVNDVFDIGNRIKPLNGITKKNEMIPYIYFAIDRNYIPLFRYYYMMEMWDSIDYSNIKLCVDKSVVEKDGENAYLKSLIKSHFQPLCNNIGSEILIVDVRRDVLDNGGFGYGNERFKELFNNEELSIPILKFLRHNTGGSYVESMRQLLIV